jgi:hypothetical protein
MQWNEMDPHLGMAADIPPIYSPQQRVLYFFSGDILSGCAVGQHGLYRTPSLYSLSLAFQCDSMSSAAEEYVSFHISLRAEARMLQRRHEAAISALT